MISRFDKFICAITEIDLYWHRLASAEMKNFDLKGNYAIYFTKLNENPNGITAANLASECGKDKADVSRDISALEKRGFVEKITKDGISYRAKIILTEQGKTLTKAIIEKAELAVKCVGKNLSDEARESFYGVLDEIKDNLKTLSRSGLPEKNKEQEN